MSNETENDARGLLKDINAGNTELANDKLQAILVNKLRDAVDVAKIKVAKKVMGDT